MFGFGAAHSRFNPFESKVGVSNVAGLQQLWSASIAQFQPTPTTVVNGVAYVGTSGNGLLAAFDAKGATNCSGSPKTCSPLWTASAVVGASYFTAPAVVSGVLYTSADDDRVYAFDATGTTNCSGTPKKCAPLWTAPVGGTPGDITVANGNVYVGASDGKLYVFDANGNTNCSGTPKTCTPLWSATAASPAGTPAIANGVVYVESGGSPGFLDAFDATGTTNCSGVPKTCTPLWTASIGSALFFPYGPAVANGTVYVGDPNGTLYWFDAAGVTGCSGTPKTCTPLATATTGGFLSSPAVANGVVYVGSGDNHLYAFAAAHNVNCSGTPTVCTALWSAPANNEVFAPTVANGIVYAGSFDGIEHAYALP
jgi:outer membrane protein assembly factor BamB